MIRFILTAQKYSSYGGYIEYLRNNASMVLWLDGSDPSEQERLL